MPETSNKKTTALKIAGIILAVAYVLLVVMFKGFENLPKGLNEVIFVWAAISVFLFLRHQNELKDKAYLYISLIIIAVMALYYAVGQWNSYFNAMIFLQNENLYPLQLVLKEILIASESTVGGSGETILQQYRLANQLKYVSVIVSSVPVLMLYPFVQKYFAQGVMIGSLKG